MARPSMSDLCVGRRDVTGRIVRAFVLVQLDESRGHGGHATAVEAFAAQAGLIEIALAVQPRRDQ